MLSEAAAPQVSISPLDSIYRNERHVFNAAITGGRYDRLEFDWAIIPPNVGVLILPQTPGAEAPYNPEGSIQRPTVITQPTTVTITCVVTAYGEGISAEAGTRAVANIAQETFTILPDLPRALAPDFLIQSHFFTGRPITGDTSFFAAPAPSSERRYDTVSYDWAIIPPNVGSLTARSGSSIQYNVPPAPRPQSTITLTCVATVRGTGTRAQDGTSDIANIVQLTFEVAAAT